MALFQQAIKLCTQFDRRYPEWLITDKQALD